MRGMKAKEEYNSPFVEGRAEMDPSLKRGAGVIRTSRSNGFWFAGFYKLCYVTRAFGPIPLEISRLPPLSCKKISNQDMIENHHR